MSATRARPLTACEEVLLARRVERGDGEARREMVERNLGLVTSVAASYRGRGVPLADLVQQGSVGLLHAVERFDHRRGHKFSTYAVWWIRRAMLDALADARPIRVPAKARRRIAAIRNAESSLERRGTRSASSRMIAELTGLEEATVERLRDSARVTASLDQPIGDGDAVLAEVLADEASVDPCERAIARDEQADLAAMLGLLPERHREVLVRRYGLNSRRPHRHSEIAAWLGVGEGRCRQIEREGLQRLRSISSVVAHRAA
ncbi:MAG TPA: RNA polymerase sigma factor RpoD/SigA [Solirubrobacteraceae bacterium]|nr:RNA polymerase sigma factor RpoD/SigA [Solirubrobacteraceae bacterium]